MKTKFTLPLLLLFCVSLFGQKVITKKIESDALQDERTIQIYVPKGYDKDSIANYPLAIVLDSEYLFDLYIGNSNLFSLTEKAPKQIVVGIEMNTTRSKDVSINKINSSLTADSNNFLKFIQDELLFYIEGNFNTSPFISIIGNGASANIITHFLRDETPIFNAYVCLNPIFSRDINSQMSSYNLNKLANIDNTYYFYMNDSQVNNEPNKTHVKNLNTFLQTLSIKNFNIKNDYIDTTPSSISAIGETIPRALSHNFELYSSITKEEFDTKIKDLSPTEAISYLENKYIEIDYLFGSNLGIRERDILAIERIIIEKENGDHLKSFGEMILNLHPHSHLGHYYIGKYYETGKKYNRALKQYRLGYGKMDPGDPKADAFYQNIQRLLRKG